VNRVLVIEIYDLAALHLAPLFNADSLPNYRLIAIKELQMKKAGIAPGPLIDDDFDYEHPLVDPHVSHFKHVPLRTMV
jgi:hypothetical protein